MTIMVARDKKEQAAKVGITDNEVDFAILQKSFGQNTKMPIG